MSGGIRQIDFGPRAETNFYLNRAQQMGKSLITGSTQRTDFGLMAVSQCTTIPRVVAEQETNFCPQVISAQRTNPCLMTVLQRMTMPRIVVNRQIYLTLQAISTQWTDSGLIPVLQWMTMLRVIARLQVDTNPFAKSARLCRQNTPRLWRKTGHLPGRREVRMIFGGLREVRNGQHARGRYSKKAKKPPYIVVHTTNSKPLMG